MNFSEKIAIRISKPVHDTLPMHQWDTDFVERRSRVERLPLGELTKVPGREPPSLDEG